MMQTVGGAELFAMLQAGEEVRAMLRQVVNATMQGAELAAVMYEVGMQAQAQAQAMGADIEAGVHIDLAAASARFEEAAVRFLGERRSIAESLPGYIQRLTEAMSDPDLLAAMLRKNGRRLAA